MFANMTTIKKKTNMFIVRLTSKCDDILRFELTFTEHSHR